MFRIFICFQVLVDIVLGFPELYFFQPVLFFCGFGWYSAGNSGTITFLVFFLWVWLEWYFIYTRFHFPGLRIFLVVIFIFPGLGEYGTPFPVFSLFSWVWGYSSKKSASILKFTFSWLRDVVPEFLELYSCFFFNLWGNSSQERNYDVFLDYAYVCYFYWVWGIRFWNLRKCQAWILCFISRIVVI